MTYRVPYAQPVYGEAEIEAVMQVLRDPSRQLAAGPRVAEFERRIAALFGKPHGVMVNSGSSANLLALASLNLPKGSRVVTPALTFATCVAPIVQLGLVPEFVDVEEGTYVVGNGGLLDARPWDCGLIPLLLGNVPTVMVCEGKPLIVDACDTLGPALPHADIVTTSFYASHVITAMGGGGMACGGEEFDFGAVRLDANWGRWSALDPRDDIEVRFRLGDGEYAYDGKFFFQRIGYNMQATEAQAAFGLAQLDRLPAFRDRRVSTFLRLRRHFAAHADVLTMPKFDRSFTMGSVPLAFPLTVKDSAPFTRLDFVRHLENAGIQTRPIMAGNILRQPAFRHLGDANRFPVADSVMRGGLLIGCHQGLGDEDIAYVQDVASDFLRERTGVAA